MPWVVKVCGRRGALGAVCCGFLMAACVTKFLVRFLVVRIACPSLPGLTRQSIDLRKASFLMDARVKPAHDKMDSISGRKRRLRGGRRPAGLLAAELYG